MRGRTGADVAGAGAGSRVGRPAVTGETAVAVDVWIGGIHHVVRLRVPGPAAASGDALLAAALLPAMRAGVPLEVPLPVSPRLCRNAGAIQDIFHSWDRRLQRIEVRTGPGAAAPGGARGVGCFFTAGVDSFYSALKHHADITALIFVHGFDLDLDDHTLRARVGDAVRRAAADLGKPLVEVETDLCGMSNRYVRWRFYNSAALACVAHFLAPRLHRVLIPASHSYAHLFPWGTHPLVDPLWSGEGVEVAHDGAEATRPEKVAAIARSEVARRWLRVCFENRDGAYNCGRCEKCLRTMVSLRAAGALERCRTFDRALDLDAVARARIRGLSARSFAEDNLAYVEAHTRDRVLAEALRESLRHAESEGPVRAIRGTLRTGPAVAGS